MRTCIKNIFGRTSVLIVLLSLLFTSCAQQESEPIDPTKDVPINIRSASVSELMTRVITSDNILSGTDDTDISMGVFVSGGTKEEYNAVNVRWTHDGTAWSAKSATLYEGKGSVQQIYAYYPYIEGTTGTITVNATDQIDWLVATSAHPASSTVNLTLTHALTKLVLDATLGTELDDETIAQVKVMNMYASGTLNVSSNTWSDVGEADDEVIMNDNEALVIPMAPCESFPVVITTGTGRVFRTDISLSGVGNKLEAGSQYTIRLHVGQDKVTLSNVTAASWGTPVDGGQLEAM